jgi:excinuclease UvrABC ATPase subunit
VEKASVLKLASFLALEKDSPTLFIFDEPTTGLHFHDIRKLLDSFNALISRGHSIIIIEHNLEVIKSADWVIDLRSRRRRPRRRIWYLKELLKTLCRKKNHIPARL